MIFPTVMLLCAPHASCRILRGAPSVPNRRYFVTTCDALIVQSVSYACTPVWD